MKCKVCGKNAQSEYCFAHKPKKQLQQQHGLKPSLSSKKGLSGGKSLQKRSSKQLLKEIDKKIQTHKMFEFFIDIWKKRPHKSEVSGDYLGNEPLSIYFHHILPKNKYPEACFDEENIVILSLLEHEQVESDMYRYEEINNRRKKLLIKYNLHHD
jgi:hypothetical protein